MKKKPALLLSIGAVVMFAFSPIANAAAIDPNPIPIDGGGGKKPLPICNDKGQCKIS
ncbi:hypothetical protein [Sporosarcina sp. Te-1]|uniref:hypothetical protein n=1 Tax=Sporosarcina sp. Te-1 TaxID=2818390 RepID=UPI001A9F316F|nr:hypothetical protein [Sporosarcina sp. Te-1]QTD40003.1 hypothetical protein J3U78_14365 [Sporosarcina sp. Te-1]